MDTTQLLPAPIRAALTVLLAAGRALHAHIVAALATHDTAALPPNLRPAPARAETRIAQALEWVVALTRTLAGDTHFLPPYRLTFPRFPGSFPPFTNELRALCGLPLNPPPTEAQRAAARLRTKRRVFATQPTGIIAARIARRLGIAQTAPDWPAHLIAITQTPAAWAKAHRAATHPNPAPTPQTDTQPAEQSPTPPPAYHKRE